MKRVAGFLLLTAAPFLGAACATTLEPASDRLLEPGRTLYAGKCHGCHRLYGPSGISAAKWPTILDKMAVKAKLTSVEKWQIDAYVSSVVKWEKGNR